MPTMPIQFQPAQEQAIASYSYTDIAEGTGVVAFYGFDSKVQTARSYGLTINTIYSNTKVTDSENITHGSPAQKHLDIDFDLSSFNSPRNIKGTAIINFTAGGGGSASCIMYLIAKIRKWDGTTETEIAQAQSETETLGSNGVVAYSTHNIKIAIPLTHFKKGETLRITMEGWGYSSTVDNGVGIHLCHDPKARTVAGTGGGANAETSQIMFYIPFKLDI